MTGASEPSGEKDRVGPADETVKRPLLSFRAMQEARLQEALREIEERHGRHLPHQRRSRLRWLECFVGGPEILAGLHGDPYPYEHLSHEGLAPDILDRLDFIALLADDTCWEALGAEHLIGTRQLLHDLALREPALFRGSSNDCLAAAAACWIVGKLNRRIAFDQVQVQDLVSHLRLRSSPAARAARFLEVLDAGPAFHRIGLGTDRYLTSARRVGLVRMREELRDVT